MTGRRWLTIAGAVAIVLVFLGIAAAIVSVSWVKAHTEFTTASEKDAASGFAEIRTRFGEQRPLIEVREGRPHVNQARADAPASTVGLTTMHVLVWEQRENQLIRFELPFWLLRLKSAPIEFGSYASGLDDVGITMTAEELERYGPGIVIDLVEKRGERILIWVE